MFYDEGVETYYVVKLLANDVNYRTSNLMSIFLQEDEEYEYEYDYDYEYDYGYEENAESETATNAEKVEAVLSSLSADSSEDNFRTLAATYNRGIILDPEGNGYSYINSNFSTEALLWVLEDRQAGDYATFETPNGTFVLYYNGNGKTYRNVVVNNYLVNEMTENLSNKALESCNFHMDAAMKASVSLYIGDYEESEVDTVPIISID